MLQVCASATHMDTQLRVEGSGVDRLDEHGVSQLDAPCTNTVLIDVQCGSG